MNLFPYLQYASVKCTSSFFSSNEMIGLSRRPLEEILKLLPGPHSETKRVSALSSLLLSLPTFRFGFTATYNI